MFQFLPASARPVAKCRSNRFYDVTKGRSQHQLADQSRELVRSTSRVIEYKYYDFYNVWRMVKDYKLNTNNAHISVETYFRFLAQDILSALR